MIDVGSYWSPLCELASQLRCWSRVVWKDGDLMREGSWGQLLAIATTGYLESAEGPTPLREVEWVDISTSDIKGGIAGRPLEFIDVSDDILAGLQGIKLDWEVRKITWSKNGFFEESPVKIIRFMNPFGPTSRS